MYLSQFCDEEAAKFNNKAFLKGEPFPKEYPINYEKLPYLHFTKYYRSFSSFIVIPKKANYINEEILTAALSGKVIETSEKHVIEIDHSLKEKYSSLF